MPDGSILKDSFHKDNTARPDRNAPEFESAMQYVRERKSDDDIRQGQTGLGVRYVLAASLTGALIALFGLYAYFTPG